MLLRFSPRAIRMQLFTVLNVAGMAVLCLLSGAKAIRAHSVTPYLRVALFFFILYFVVVLLHYVALRLCRRDGTLWPTVAFLFPIVLLIYIKYASDYLNPFGPL